MQLLEVFCMAIALRRSHPLNLTKTVNELPGLCNPVRSEGSAIKDIGLHSQGNTDPLSE